MQEIKAINNESNYIYFKRDWFKNVIENNFDIEMFFEFCELGKEEFGEKIKQRNKIKAHNKKHSTNEPLPHIFDESESVDYLRLARLYVLAEPTNKTEMVAMMIAQYINAQCKKDKNHSNLKPMKFESIAKVFGLTVEQIGQVITKCGEDYYLSIASKQERITRPKKIYYALFNNDNFIEDYKNIDTDYVAEDDTFEIEGEIQW